MVCKEDVILWFKDLESYKRIDVMYDLLNMCAPFEVRFLGSCIEEVGKHTFQELRGQSIVANDLERLSKDGSLKVGLQDETSRHCAVIYLSLLSAKNCTCANWFYRTLFRSECFELYVNSLDGLNSYGKDELSELLLLFTLAFIHPAFTFEQKCFFSTTLEKLIAHKNENCKPYSTHCFLQGTVPCPRNLSSQHYDAPPIPVKSSSMVSAGETVHIQHPPPGLPPLHIAHPNMDYMSIGRTGFVTPAEIHPFPPQPISPLVSQATSPPQSRASSPRTHIRPLMTVLPPPAHGEQIATIVHAKVPLSHAHTMPYRTTTPDTINTKRNGDDNNHITDDWQLRGGVYEIVKPINGLREQLQMLKISSNSSPASSSNSSLNQSPPDTPSATPTITPHGPGRGGPADAKGTAVRVNGMSAQAPPPQQFICDMGGAPPAPPPPPFSNCTVPSYTYPHSDPTRYLPQTFRPQFTAFPYQTNDPALYPYLIYSSVLPTHAPRNPNCFNCGHIGHTGIECSGQTVEEITQMPYTIEYESSALQVPENLPDK